MRENQQLQAGCNLSVRAVERSLICEGLSETREPLDPELFVPF